VFLAKGSDAGNRVPVYAIDPHTGAQMERDMFNNGKPLWSFYEFKKNIKDAGVEHLIVPILKTSVEVSENWDKEVGLIWIDGDHSYEMVTQDFKSWRGFLVKGGVIAFHDSTNPFFGVEKMLRDYLFKDKQFSRFGLVSGIVYAVRTDDPSIVRFFFLLKLKLSIAIVKIFRLFPIPLGFKGAAKSFVKKILGQGSDVRS
jgi:hypothetical protein